MTELVITIPGTARGKARPRMTRTGRVYTPKSTVNAETWIKQCAYDQVGMPVLQGPLAVSIDISVAVPASWPRKKRDDALAGVLRPTGKPDLDNTTKAFLDALNGIVWRDDAQVVDLAVSKRYAEHGMTVVSVSTKHVDCPVNPQ